MSAHPVSIARAVAALLAACAASAHAADFGTIGPTYPVAEPHFIEAMQAKARAFEQGPAFARLKEESRSRAARSVNNPAPVPGITTAAVARTYYHDPTYTLDRNIFDHEGRLLFPAGTRKNPLEVVSLAEHLLFFDARDRAQVKHARKLIEHYRGKVTPILVGGSYVELMKSWKLRVYYDQHGVITRQLGITGVPALVSQEGMRLRIDELVL